MKVRGGWDIVAGVFLLILIYLILSKGRTVNDLLTVFSGSTLKGIALLQGRKTTTVVI